MPFEVWRSALINAACHVLEEMRFVFVTAETEIDNGSDAYPSPLLSVWQDGNERKLGKQVTFSGLLCGIIHLRFSHRVADAPTANLLGSEIIPTGIGSISYACEEITNMICGSVSGVLKAKQGFTTDTPVDAVLPTSGGNTTRLFHAEKGPLISFLSFGGAAQ